jgi:hypothetical protein
LDIARYDVARLAFICCMLGRASPVRIHAAGILRNFEALKYARNKLRMPCAAARRRHSSVR